MNKNAALSAGMAIALLAACASNPPPRPQHLALGDFASTERYIAQLIRHEMAKERIAGLSIALVDDQRVLWARGFGFADLRGGVAATAETVYPVGSISKLFTAAAVMQLADQGRVDIDRPIQAYLPEFSTNTRFSPAPPVTLRNLMSHHSGLPENIMSGMWAPEPAPLARVVDALANEYVAYPPGFVLSYSNVGYSLLGRVVEKVTGEEFSARLNDSLLRPLGMTHSSFSARPGAATLAKAYLGDKEMVLPGLRDVPAGGLSASVTDLCRFMQMIFADGRSNGRTILRPETVAEMLRPQNSDVALDQSFHVGLGWIEGGLGGMHIGNAGKIVHHGGAYPAFHGYMMASPEHKLGVVVLANSWSAFRSVSRVAAETLKVALEAKTGIKPPLPEATVEASRPLDVAEAQAFEGWWATDYGLVKVTRRDAALRAEVLGRSIELAPLAEREVRLRYRLLGIIEIGLGPLGEIGLSRASFSGRDLLIARTGNQRLVVGEKVGPTQIPPAWQQLVGDYQVTNRNDDSVVLEKVALRVREGFLTLEYAVPPFFDVGLALAIKPIADTEAIVLGIGRGKGETIRVVDTGGGKRLSYNGYLLRKTAD